MKFIAYLLVIPVCLFLLLAVIGMAITPHAKIIKPHAGINYFMGVVLLENYEKFDFKDCTVVLRAHGTYSVKHIDIAAGKEVVLEPQMFGNSDSDEVFNPDKYGALFRPSEIFFECDTVNGKRGASRIFD